jgi:hypothetical protein
MCREFGCREFGSTVVAFTNDATRKSDGSVVDG